MQRAYKCMLHDNVSWRWTEDCDVFACAHEVDQLWEIPHDATECEFVVSTKPMRESWLIDFGVVEAWVRSHRIQRHWLPQYTTDTLRAEFGHPERLYVKVRYWEESGT